MAGLEVQCDSLALFAAVLTKKVSSDVFAEQDEQASIDAVSFRSRIRPTPATIAKPASIAEELSKASCVHFGLLDGHDVRL